ncbi:E3 ubiquitin-protein ligase Praja-2 [Mactra antiquata]
MENYGGARPKIKPEHSTVNNEDKVDELNSSTRTTPGSHKRNGQVEGPKTVLHQRNGHVGGTQAVSRQRSDNNGETQTVSPSVAVTDLKLGNHDLLVIIQSPVRTCLNVCDSTNVCCDILNSHACDLILSDSKNSVKTGENDKKSRKNGSKSSSNDEKSPDISVKEKWRQSGLALKNYVSEKLGFKSKKSKKLDNIPLSKNSDVSETTVSGSAPQSVDKLTRSRSFLKYLGNKKDKVSKNFRNEKMKKSISLELSSSDRPMSSSDFSSANSDWSSENALTNPSSRFNSVTNGIICNICSCSLVQDSKPFEQSGLNRKNKSQYLCKRHKCKKQCLKNQRTNSASTNCVKMKSGKSHKKHFVDVNGESKLDTDSDTDCGTVGKHVDTTNQRHTKHGCQGRLRKGSSRSNKLSEDSNATKSFISESTLNAISGLQYAIPYLPERFRNRLHNTSQNGPGEVTAGIQLQDLSSKTTGKVADKVATKNLDVQTKMPERKEISGNDITGREVISSKDNEREVTGREKVKRETTGLESFKSDKNVSTSSWENIRSERRDQVHSKGKYTRDLYDTADMNEKPVDEDFIARPCHHDSSSYPTEINDTENDYRSIRMSDSLDYMDDLVLGFEATLEDPFNVRYNTTDGNTSICAGLLDIVHTNDNTLHSDHIDGTDNDYPDDSTSDRYSGITNAPRRYSDNADTDRYSMSSSGDNGLFSKALLLSGHSDMTDQSNISSGLHDFDHQSSSHYNYIGNRSTLTSLYDDSSVSEGNQSTLTGLYDSNSVTDRNQSTLYENDSDYPGYKALNDSFDKLLQDDDSSTSDSLFRVHLQRSRSNESGLRSRSSDDNIEADDEYECDCDHCQYLLSQRSSSERNSSNDNVTVATTNNLTQATGNNVTETTGRYSPEMLDDFRSPFDVDIYSDTTFRDHDADQYRSIQSWDIGLPFQPNIPLLLSGSPLGELLEDVIEHMLAARPELFLDEPYPPAQKTVIDNLPTLSLTVEHIEQHPSCPICLCPTEVGEIMTFLPCQHIFHPLCIQAWLNKSGTCPVCRRKIRSS